VAVANSAKVTLPIPKNLPPMTCCRPISEDSCSREPVITSSVRTDMVVPHKTASGPNSRRRHGPSRAIAEIAVVKSPTQATTLTMGTGKRHHGRKLAKNVDTGTLAATTATRRVSSRS
jgi:hypothetical protein